MLFFVFAYDNCFLTRLQNNHFHFLVVTMGFFVTMSEIVQDNHLRLFDNAVYADLAEEGWDFGKNGGMNEVRRADLR